MSKIKRKLKAWSTEEVDFLKNNCHISIKRIAKKLKRSESSVSQKMRKLGCIKSIIPTKKMTPCEIGSIEMINLMGHIGESDVKEECDTEKTLTNGEKRILHQANEALGIDYKKTHQKNIDECEDIIKEMKGDREVIEVDIEGLIISYNKWTRKIKIKTS